MWTAKQDKGGHSATGEGVGEVPPVGTEKDFEGQPGAWLPPQNCCSVLNGVSTFVKYVIKHADRHGQG